MFFTLKQFALDHPDVKNPAAYLHYEAKVGRILRLKRDLYTDNPDENPLLIASVLHRPSYVSFQYALSFYGLIPERVYEITMASTNLRKAIVYSNQRWRCSYRDVPVEAYPWGLFSDEMGFLMATPEKALCDLLHVYPSVRSVKDLCDLLFEDLRIDEEAFENMNKGDLLFLCSRYPGDTFRVLRTLILKRKINESDLI